MKLVDPKCHEFQANFIYASEGLRPFFATDRAVKDAGGSRKSEFEACGERWKTTLYYQDSGIVSPGDMTPTGTNWQLEEVREFRLSIEAADDPREQKSLNAHMAPRWQGMEVENDEGEKSEFSVPDAITEGVNISVKGSNIAFSKYRELIAEGFESVGVSRAYFENPHDVSNTQDAAVYVRLDRDRSGPIHARDGPIASMAHLLENDREGVRELKQRDSDLEGERLPGWYHTVNLGPKRITEAFPSHQTPKEIKHYYAREARNKAPNHPLSHPKLEVSYQVAKWDGKIGVEPEALDELKNELTETLYSVLRDAGIQVHSGENGPYVEDAYFAAENVEYQEDPTVSLNLTQLRTTQESVVIKHLRDGLSPVEWESLSTLVTDGGEIAPSDIADEHDRHPDSVRRALSRIDELVERKYNRVSLRSNHVAELVHDAVEQAENAVQDAVEMSAKALEAADRRIDEGMSALVAWAASRDLDLDHGEEVNIRLGNVEADTMRDAKDEIRRILREGQEIWTEAGQDPEAFRCGEFTARAEVQKFPGAKSLSQTTTKTLAGFIGQYVLS